MSENVHYLPILVRDADVSDWERDFCASLIAQQRRGRPLSSRQNAVLDRIADAFRRRAMTRDGEVLE